MVKVNLGCGAQILDGWINVDYALGARLAKIPLFRFINRKLRLFSMEWDGRIFLHDLRRPFPWKDASIDAIYSSHTLEHLTRTEGVMLIDECYRVLKPGGIIRLVVPDLAANIEHYLCGKTRADYFLEGMEILYSTDRNPTVGWFRKMITPFVECPHKCYYDSRTLVSILNQAGFQAASMKAFESRLAGIREIELEDRTEYAIMIEGVKVTESVLKSREMALPASGREMEELEFALAEMPHSS